MKKTYLKPAINTVALCLSHLLAASSGDSAGSPSANFMSNPGIGDDDE